MQLPELMTIQPEMEYQKTVPLEHRKAFGQIFTPVQVAHFMISWITDKVKTGHLLDPALGMGIFFRQLLQQGQGEYRLDGFELDPTLADQTNRLFSQSSLPLTCYQQDFLLAEEGQRYDGIICNPPYIHFQDYQQSLHLIQTFNDKYRLQLNGFSNIYALFLIKSLQHLKKTGRAAFILPSEFLNADYGKSIKEWLVEHKNLAHLIVFDPAIQLFEGFLTTSSILLFEGQAQEKLQIFNVQELGQLEEIRKIIRPMVKEVGVESAGTTKEPTAVRVKEESSQDDSGGTGSPTGASSSQPTQRVFSYQQLNPKIKWKFYYGDLKYNLHLVQSHSEGTSKLVPFQTFASTRRGIATGANDFFTLSEQEVKRWQLNAQYLTPCLTRASHVQKQILTETDWQQIANSGKKAYLLNLHDQIPDPALKAYLRWGEEQGYHTRYLTRHRNPWYRMEPSTPADLLVKTFGRQQAVFIENQTQALNLTCFHGIFLNELGHQYQQAIFLYLQTDLAKAIFEGQKREYGQGLGKFEPNDIKQALMVDFTRLTAGDQLTLLQLYQEFVAVNNQLHTGKDSTGVAERSNEILQQVEELFWAYW